MLFSLRKETVNSLFAADATIQQMLNAFVKTLNLPVQTIVYKDVLVASDFINREQAVTNECTTVKRMDVSPLGSGALAGTTYPIDRAMSAKLLGFEGGYTQNTLDGVADRDFCADL